MLLALGGKLIVDGAVTVASGLGIGESVIGATVVAVGTSIPELAMTGSIILFVCMFTGKRRTLDRWEGCLLVIGYAAYVV